MGQFGEYVKMAIDNILSNKGRSILTMLGIIIGISSVITVVAVGTGVKNTVQDSSNAAQQVVITATQDDNPVTCITMDDISAIEAALGTRQKGVIVSSQGYGSISTGKGNFDASINFTLPGAQNQPGEKAIIAGNYFTDDDVANSELVAVIDKNSAIMMFGNTDVLGMTVELSVDNVIQEVTICGIEDANTEEIEQSKQLADAFGSNLTITFSMPYTASAAFDNEIDSFGAVIIYPMDSEEASAIAKVTCQTLASRHLSDSDVVFSKQKDVDLGEMMGGALDAVTYFVALVAAISLVVGGIGVMNIMLVSVTERTREIGIRKALGARISSITIQFLCESAIISGLGGLIGIILGFTFAKLIAVFNASMKPMVTWQVVLIATAFSCGVGIIFGIYPARKAAKLSPIEALRQM